MFLRLTFLSFSPSKKEESREIYMNEVAPIIRKQKGNKDASLLVPVDENDEHVSSSLWDNEADLRLFEQSEAYKKLIGRISEIVDKKPYQKYFTVER